MFISSSMFIQRRFSKLCWLQKACPSESEFSAATPYPGWGKGARTISIYNKHTYTYNYCKKVHMLYINGCGRITVYIYTHSQVISHWYLPDYVCTQMHIDTLHSHRWKICPAPAPEIASCGRPASPHRWWQERHSLRGFIDRSLNSNWWIYHVHQSFYHFLSVYTYIIIYPSSYSMFTDWIYKFFALKSSLAHSEHQAQ